jgi:hypothetical protein
MSRTAPSVLLAAALALGVSACGGDDPASTASTATPSPSPSAASPSPSASEPEPSPSSEIGAVAIYYLRDTGRTGPRLYREFHALPTSDEPVRDAVEAMLAQPPKDPDYASLWADGVEVLDVAVEGATATVDLSQEARSNGGGSAFEQATLQQLVHTVTAADNSVTSVRLLVEGSPVETLWGAADVSQPLTRGPAAEVLGPVWVLTPEQGGSVPRGGEVGGEASVFEATVSWEWVQGDTVVAEGFSTAEEGAPGRGAWSTRADVPPGDYVFRAFESSAEDGSVTFLDTKDVTVTE